MPSLKEVKGRIKSVQSTQQITKAMKMVAAAKLRRAQDRILQLRPYAEKLNEILDNLSHDSSEGLLSPYFENREPHHPHRPVFHRQPAVGDQLGRSHRRCDRRVTRAFRSYCRLCGDRPQQQRERSHASGSDPPKATTQPKQVAHRNVGQHFINRSRRRRNRSQSARSHRADVGRRAPVRPR